MDESPAPTTHPYPILIVDDDWAVRQLLVEVVSLEDFRAATVPGGSECLNYLAAHREPHILLLDLIMPPLDGWGVLRHLRSHPHLRRRLAVNVHTAYCHFERLPRKTYGPVLDGLLACPFPLELLLERLATLEAKLTARLARH